MTKKKGLLTGFFSCWLIFVGTAMAADFDIMIVSTEGDVTTISITNRYGVPVYIYDLVWNDGSSVDIHEDITEALTLQIQGDVGGIVKARCTAPSTQPPTEGYFFEPGNEDGFNHLTAEVF
jgi:hypothetical protein